ncbi:tRNA-intron endonuclease [archaeon GW2011_AR15]|nr:tRNA-intron endonuclease [archaeon GW2011_AR15]MBS3103910.1 tRNA-intron lyase [Candidatus Woesearchaeota archaeon]
MPKQKEDPGPREPVMAKFYKGEVLLEKSPAALELFNQSRYGALRGERVILSPIEGLYLLEKERLEVTDARNHKLDYDEYLKKAARAQPNFPTRYAVFRDLRNRGYIVKTALKFGADFRVYERGVRPGDDHAKWVVYPVQEGETLTWYEFAAKNRVAHSTKKRLLLGVADEEQDVSYWECRWVRP